LKQRYRVMFARRFIELRLTAEYPDIADAPQAMLHTVADALSAHYGVPYRKLWINQYRTRRDSTGWHGDLIGKVQQTSIVPVLSLGATPRFLIRPAAAGGASTSFAVSSGDLIVMGGRSQREWRHCVPKQTIPASPRISVNFAPILSWPPGSVIWSSISINLWQPRQAAHELPVHGGDCEHLKGA
jgi:hypothetical protein